MASQLEAVLASTRVGVLARDTSTWTEKERLLIEACHPKQRDFALDPGRRVAALVARGGGKTTGGRARFVRRMMRTHRAKCLFVATTRDQAVELLWSPLKEILDKLEIQATFNETALRCTFRKNEAQLRLVGADDKKQIEKYRGQPHHEVGIDEAASYQTQLLEHLIFRIIAPRLGDYNGVLWLTGTPGHILAGPFYEATRPGSEISRPYAERGRAEFADWNRWSLHQWSLQDGAPYIPAMARLWAEALLEKESNGWSDQNPVWRREYLGEWAADDTENVYKYRAHLDDGSPWNEWDPKRDAHGYAELPEAFKDWRIVYGLDMGHSDPFSLEVFAYSPSDASKTLYHVYEFERRGMYARTIAELLLGEGLDATNPRGLIGRSGWPDAMVADHAQGESLFDELANVYGLRIAAAEKRDKFDNIELFNGDLIDGRIKVLKGSRLAEQLLHLQWAVDEFGRLKEHKGQRNDCTDAAIYARRRAQHLLAEEAPPPKVKATSEFRRIADETDDDTDSNADDYADVLNDEANYDADFWG